MLSELVARLNSARYRKLLETESDPVRRATIARLIGEEDRKLIEMKATADRGRPDAK